MPHMLDVKCPSCGKQALFEFAEIVKITLKKDVPFFEKSDLFEYYQFTDSSGHKWHAAAFYANLHGGSTQVINELPEGYHPENWNHSKHPVINHRTNLGGITCNHCHTRKIHRLTWPDDAFYSVDIKGELLWAFNRESAVVLRDYIASSERKTSDYQWARFLLHIPTIFKKQNVRDILVKKLNKLLEYSW